MKKALLAAALLVTAAAPAAAVTETMTFSGTVNPVCTITIDSPGVLVPDATLVQLSTRQVGGTAGMATIQTTGSSFNVSTTAPSAFTSAPAGADANVTFAALYSATGATTLSDVPGATPSPLGQGTTTLNVNLTAMKSSGTFPDGEYSADLVVTCE
ncbi:hypothetical protein [Chelativorans sp. J32]|uniref:hypothetical protein n=1 Tax=Chelativorans sp. J32 TaxID=935840 RepID=UPI000480111D|nr:hypothetical protein [Chelativorans sp. J32]